MAQHAAHRSQKGTLALLELLAQDVPVGRPTP
jgi:hypothetical protein